VEGFGNIAVGVRCTNPDPMFFVSWTGLIMAGIRSGDKVLPPAVDVPHHLAAEILATYFLDQTDADTLLFLDDDQTFPVDMLSRLRDKPENHAFGVLGARYCRRHCNHSPVPSTELVGNASGATVEVPYVGLGATLVRRAVFLSIKAGRAKDETMFYWPRTVPCGEDVAFCGEAAALGYKVGVDTSVSIGHRGALTIEWDDETKAPAYRSHINWGYLRMASKTIQAQESNTQE